jgi:DNA polymerase (family 10)
LRRSVPEGIFEMLRIQGLGPKKVKALWEKLGIATVAELEYACRGDRCSC